MISAQAPSAFQRKGELPHTDRRYFTLANMSVVREADSAIIISGRAPPRDDQVRPPALIGRLYDVEREAKQNESDALAIKELR